MHRPTEPNDPSMCTGDLMSAPVEVVAPEDSLAYASQFMVDAGVRHLPVMRGPKVVGVLSERDVLRRGRSAGPDTVASAMSQPAVTVPPDAPIGVAMSLMLGRKIGCLPVVDAGGALVGILTATDILRDQLQANPAPATTCPRREGGLP